MSNTSDFIADATVPAAAAIAESNTLIADAMGYTALPAAYKTAIWDAIDATWALGRVPTVSSPASRESDPVTHLYQGGWNASTNTPTLASGTGTENHFYYCNNAGTLDPALDGQAFWGLGSKPTFKDGAWIDTSTNAYFYVTCTQAEAQAIYGHKVAHALWLEHTQEFPWRITSYSLEECKGLFDPTYVFWYRWNVTTAPYLEFAGSCDHDPYSTYDLVKTGICSGFTHTNPKRTIAKILEECSQSGAYKSVHFGNSDPRGSLTPAEYHSTANRRSGQTYTISRHGCHSSASMLAAVARSINLPTKEYHAILEGGGHHSMEFLSIRLPHLDDDLVSPSSPFYIDAYTDETKGAVLTHGDWITDVRWDKIPGANKLVPRGYHEDQVFGKPGATITLNQIRSAYYRYFEYLATDYWLGVYQTDGWATFKTTHLDPYLLAPGSEPWTSRIRADLKARNGGVEIP